MLFTGLEVCAHNINRRQKNLKLFEFGKVYGKKNGHYFERDCLALYITGDTHEAHWQSPAGAVTYHDLARYVAQVLSKSAITIDDQQPIQDQLLEYGMKIMVNHTFAGKLGKVKPALCKLLGIKQQIFYAELDAALLFMTASPKFDVQEVPKYPEVRRDLSLVLDKQVTFAQIKELVLATERELIKEIMAFDVYEGDKIPQGKKAYALAITLLNDQKTLTDQEIDATMNKLMTAFETKMQAVIRK
jgi:phenylalanyl-tRNA synthetase beta chain